MKAFSLEEYLKNPSKKVVTRKGLSVRILATDLEDEDFPIAAAIENRYPVAYTSIGRRNYELKHDDDNDLFFATEKREGWLNIYRSKEYGFYTRGKYPYNSKDEADKVAKANHRTFFATVKVEWEE